ncbi:hypothetical protein OHA98_26975 [Streptomyces sp. NBC_00654]|uniref:hypothetical protein n=1 Tax=Streptomyces sp. NBC_00654 TaxID=2975799 RepID=UPI002258D0B8|nr:hypothetical protein [Streptomyces sp. NBC_00654]MCX4968335.1 hypothetical protein [Streptomyces sp. NBC_00654]
MTDPLSPPPAVVAVLGPCHRPMPSYGPVSFSASEQGHGAEDMAAGHFASFGT